MHHNSILSLSNGPSIDEKFVEDLTSNILKSGISEITVRVALLPYSPTSYPYGQMPAILMLRRAWPHSEAGTYELPGGKTKSCYGIIEEIYRESLVETGLKLFEINKYIKRIDVTKNRKDIAVLFFGADLSLKKTVSPQDVVITLNKGEHDNYLWVNDYNVSKIPLSSETNKLLESGFKIKELVSDEYNSKNKRLISILKEMGKSPFLRMNYGTLF